MMVILACLMYFSTGTVLTNIFHIVRYQVMLAISFVFLLFTSSDILGWLEVIFLTSTIMGESFAINVSAKLVNQLANDADKLKKKSKKPKLKIPQGSQQPKTAASQDAYISSEIHKSAPSSGWPLQPPLFLPVSPPPSVANAELDAIRSVLQESESVLERLQKQEANMVQEVTQRAKELHDREFKLPYQKPIPCLAEKDACLECYREHAKDPLRCAHVVKVFADCARVSRQQASVTPNK